MDRELEDIFGTDPYDNLDDVPGQIQGNASKKPRISEHQLLEAFSCAAEQEEYVYKIEFDVTAKNYKKFISNGSVFAAQRIRTSEVRYEKLTHADRDLFDEGKARELTEFLQRVACRRCETAHEAARAEGRTIGARWVLTWKPIPDEEREAALKKRSDAVQVGEPSSIHPSGEKKAKARIVLLGYQHPDLGKGLKTSSPVQSHLARMTFYQLVAWKGWLLESYDATSAYLQAEGQQERQDIYTKGVEELAIAMGIPFGEALKILLAWYGLTDAPRCFWMDADKKFVNKLKAIKISCDPCSWIFIRDGHLVGAAGTHVDDFQIAGFDKDPRWQHVRKDILGLYEWGAGNRGTYRYAGINVVQHVDRSVTLNQDHYLEALPDLAIDGKRLTSNDEMTEKDMYACSASLGSLQWLAVQTQPLLAARVGLLQSRNREGAAMEVAREVQKLINDAKKARVKELHFCRHATCKTWTDLAVITFGDSSFNNRPKGKSTGGMLTVIGPRTAIDGDTVELSPLGWRSWGLTRTGRSSNECEVQAITESEDHNYRARLMWAEFNGAGASRIAPPMARPKDWVTQINQIVNMVTGVTATDSKGGYDAIEIQESAGLGMASGRTAVEALALKQVFSAGIGLLIWLASDWNLGDGFTKAAAEAREGLVTFLVTHRWRLRFDKNFVVSTKKAGRQAVSTILDSMGDVSTEVNHHVLIEEVTCNAEVTKSKDDT